MIQASLLDPVYAPDVGRVERPIYGVAMALPVSTHYLLDDGTWASEALLDSRDWADVFYGCRVQAERKSARHRGSFVVRCG